MQTKIERSVGMIEAIPQPYSVTVTTAGNVTEIKVVKEVPPEIPVKRVDGDHYIDLRNGETFTYSHKDNRVGNIQSFYDTLNRLRGIINANTMEFERVRWITLTYRENMQDTKRLYRDFECFWKRFKRRCLAIGWAVPEYISVAEPQARGAWHLHSIFVFPSIAPYIENSMLADCWKQGFVKIKSVYGDNLGAYFSAYLTDIPFDEMSEDTLQYEVSLDRLIERAIDDESGQKVAKKFVKGARVYLYPSGFNLYRCSRGVAVPKVEKISVAEIEKERASAGTLTYSQTLGVVAVDEENHSETSINVITYEYYNKKR